MPYDTHSIIRRIDKVRPKKFQQHIARLNFSRLWYWILKLCEVFERRVTDLKLRNLEKVWSGMAIITGAKKKLLIF